MPAPRKFVRNRCWWHYCKLQMLLIKMCLRFLITIIISEVLYYKFEWLFVFLVFASQISRENKTKNRQHLILATVILSEHVRFQTNPFKPTWPVTSKRSCKLWIFITGKTASKVFGLGTALYLFNKQICQHLTLFRIRHSRPGSDQAINIYNL